MVPKENPDYQNAGLATSIIKFMKPKCLRIDEDEDKMQMHPEEKQKLQQAIDKAKERTLEEWLLASPSLNKNYSNNGGEYYVFKSFSSPIPKVHVHSSLYGNKAEYISNSLERLLKVDQVEKQEELIRRSQSGKIKKRVTFRLPQESDIFIFYSPREKSVE